MKGEKTAAQEKRYAKQDEGSFVHKLKMPEKHLNLRGRILLMRPQKSEANQISQVSNRISQNNFKIKLKLIKIIPNSTISVNFCNLLKMPVKNEP